MKCLGVIYLGHLSCLVFSEVPGPAIWCLTLIGGNCFKCFFCSCLSFFSCWNSQLCTCHTFVVVLHSSDIIISFFFLGLCSLGFSILEVSIEIFSSSEVLSSAVSSLLISPLKAFPSQCVFDM